ncbi:MAG: polyphosphate:AMP phosphotransferase [Pseudomonadales bacterium]|jgi:polyphosphate:AMP phosphotransferase|nr:polyphosphate:AMP phosphotransferase [Pseudomonadales bacterium]
MFEVAEVGRSVDDDTFEALEEDLRTRLLDAQFRARDARVPVIVIVAGTEGAGRGRVVDRLTEWLDTRGVDVRAFWDETDEERNRPRWWRFWRALPPRGSVAVFFGSWYTRPVLDRVAERLDAAGFDAALRRIEFVERMLVEDGALVVKLWFHLATTLQRNRLKADLKARGYKRKAVEKRLDEVEEALPRLRSAGERAIRLTDSGHSPWHVIEASDGNYRDLRAGQILLELLERRLAETESRVGSEPPELVRPPMPGPQPTLLEHIDLRQSLDRDGYRERLRKAQDRLYRLAWAFHRKQRHVVGVFEGWDAAGKGGAIRRLTRAMDARLYRTISVRAPTDEELAHHYLWRFWRHLPMRGYMVLYDRSWYGRVLVERVEGFASRHEWQRAYLEINDFEEQLVDHGTVLVKFWLHVSPEEQLERFRSREATPWKMYKITDEDWRNREQRPAYEEAVNEMLARTSTEFAPWTLVAADDKRHARVQVIETFCDRLEESLG